MGKLGLDCHRMNTDWHQHHRTVSAYFANGSFTDIAKIEGGEAYKAFMLDERKPPSSALDSTARFCPFTQQLCRYWPIQSVRSKASNPLAPMLKALVHAFEAALEMDIHSAMISAHGLEDLESAYPHVQATFGEMGVESWIGPRRVVRYLMSALQLEGPCGDPDDFGDALGRPQHILAIEYTRKAMTAVMWGEECSDYWWLSAVSSAGYGRDAISACRSKNDDGDHCNVDMKAAFRKLVRTATIRAKSPSLGTVLVFGERADDENLRLVLRQSLEDDFKNGASIVPARLQDFSPDLAFAGSRAMAMFEVEHKEWRRELTKEGRSDHGEL